MCFVSVFWPMFASATMNATWSDFTEIGITYVLAPVVILLGLNEMVAHKFSLRALAVSAIVIALGAVIRPLGAGVAGIEPIWFLLIVVAWTYGPTMGFVIAHLTLLVSALFTGGIGPWLPYQMIGAGWIALGAGLCSTVFAHNNRVIATLYAGTATFFYGWILNMWFWRSLTGLRPEWGYDINLEPIERFINLARFSLTTSLAFDVLRAALTAGLLFVGFHRLQQALRRAAPDLVALQTSRST